MLSSRENNITAVIRQKGESETMADTSLALEAILVVAGLQESFSSKSQVPRFQRLLHSTFIYAIETIALQRIL